MAALDRLCAAATAQTTTIESLQKLLSEDAVAAAINARDDDGRTALHCHVASPACRVDLVRELVAHGARADGSDDDGWTPLHSAASAGRVAAVALLLTLDGVKVDAQTSAKRTPLHYACSKGHREIVERLVAAGAKATLSDKYGSTPLHRACARGDLDIVNEVLQAAGGKARELVRRGDKHGETPLHVAAAERLGALCELLIENGADPSDKNHDGETPADVCTDSDLKRRLRGGA